MTLAPARELDCELEVSVCWQVKKVQETEQKNQNHDRAIKETYQKRIKERESCARWEVSAILDYANTSVSIRLGVIQTQTDSS